MADSLCPTHPTESTTKDHENEVHHAEIASSLFMPTFYRTDHVQLPSRFTTAFLIQNSTSYCHQVEGYPIVFGSNDKQYIANFLHNVYLSDIQKLNSPFFLTSHCSKSHRLKGEYQIGTPLDTPQPYC